VTCLQHQQCFVILGGNCKIIQFHSANKFIVASSRFAYYMSVYQVTVKYTSTLWRRLWINHFEMVQIIVRISLPSIFTKSSVFYSSRRENKNIQLDFIGWSLKLAVLQPSLIRLL
jgi:hypothetical protein